MLTCNMKTSGYDGSIAAAGPGYADFIKITILGFAISALWNSMGSIIMPLRVLDVAGESRKNTLLGILTFTGLVMAAIIQPLAGAASDSTASRWGRRRPYILAGAIAAVVLLPALGIAGSYLSLFLAYALLQIASNTAHGPWQGLIPDLVPAEKRGRTSGIKGFIEGIGALVGIQLVGFFLSERFSGPRTSGLWFALAGLVLIMLGAMFFYAFAVAQLPLALFLDRIGARITMTALSFIAAIGAAVFATAHGPGQAALGRALLGLGRRSRRSPQQPPDKQWEASFYCHGLMRFPCASG